MNRDPLLAPRQGRAPSLQLPLPVFQQSRQRVLCPAEPRVSRLVQQRVLSWAEQQVAYPAA
ncbi:MAG: hypothetical protein ACT4PQ_09775 [Betaproteobacteria bacterium]